MEIFARFRNSGHRDEDEPSLAEATVPEVLPEINTRVTIARPGIPPAVTRVDDETEDELVLSLPTIPLHEGETVYLSWEEYGRAYTFETTITALDLSSHRPSVHVSRAGRISELREQVRTSQMATVARPLSIKVLVARELHSGQVLNTETVSVGPTSVRFTTSAPLSPGDTLELTIYLESGEDVRMRTRVIRMDSVRDSWRRMCNVAITEMLRSDRNLLLQSIGVTQAAEFPTAHPGQ